MEFKAIYQYRTAWNDDRFPINKHTQYTFQLGSQLSYVNPNNIIVVDLKIGTGFGLDAFNRIINL